MKQVFTFFVFLIPYFIVKAQQPTFEWARNMGGTAGDVGYSIAVDALGNVYTTGSFQGTADFDPGIGTFNLASVGANDIFITKLDASGNFVWAKSMGGTSDDFGNSIAVDASGNVYTTGYFQNTVDFDPGAASVNFTSAGIFDIFISKLDASGNLVWAKQVAGSSYDIGYGIAVDASANVFITGIFQGTTDFDPGPGTINLTSAGGADIFVSKLDLLGNFIWVKQMGGTAGNFGYSIAIDPSGNIITTGMFNGTADFDPGVGTAILTAASDDIFVSKLDASGNFVWAKKIGGSSGDGGNSVAVDASGNVYTTGYFEGAVDFDPGGGTTNITSVAGRDIFISKFDASGNFLWAKSMGGTSLDYAQSIAVDGSGNVYTTGSFYGTVDFDPSSAIYYLSAPRGGLFVSKLDAAGNFVWANQVAEAQGLSITTNASASVYTTGYFITTADFDPSAGTTLLTPIGSVDIFVLKYSQCIIQTWYLDQDNDGFGNNNSTVQGCSAPAGYVINNTDCNDNDATVHTAITYYRDVDGDGYGNGSITNSICSQTPPAGYVSNNTDCNDNDNAVYPGAPELCDSKDNNCNSTIDEGCNTIPSISINDITMYEAQQLTVFTVTLSAVHNQPVKVRYQTVDGTALSKGRYKDFTADKGVITIPAGSIAIQGAINIYLVQDNLSEPTEYFDVVLSKPINGIISDNSGRVTILDGAAATTRNTSISYAEENVAIKDLSFSIFPNPSTSFFTLLIESDNRTEKVHLKIMNIAGQIIETRNVIPEQTVRMGENYHPGIYLIEAIQGNKRKSIKVIKLSN